MQKRNFNQARKQREATRKARQQEKLDRKHSRGGKPVTTETPAGTADTDTGTDADAKATS